MKNKGFTLVEVLIVIAIIAIVLTIIAGALGSGCNDYPKNKPSADYYAMEFAKKMGGEVTGVVCVAQDTDGDGYVSCTVFRKDRDPFAIECASQFTYNQGCKMPKMKPQIQQ